MALHELAPDILLLGAGGLTGLLAMVGYLAWTACRRGRQASRLSQALQYEMAARTRAETQLQAQHEALVQCAQLTTMGSLLASVAHELKNPLAVIRLQADLLTAEVPAGLMAERVTKIAQAAARGAHLVQHCLALAPHPVSERRMVQLNTVIEASVDLLAAALQGDNVAVVLQLTADLPMIWAHAPQLQQVIVNLLTNAHQALQDVPAPRQLTITTQTNATRSQVQCTIRDNGPGIPSDVRARIFEPFFTTKPPGVGTGLGLALCQEIMACHAGSIQVTSDPGQGATFQVCLPVGEAPEMGPRSPATALCTTVPPQTILVVDDEPGITSALAYLLQGEGHHVDTAANGHLALARLQERPYDLILSDVRMPDLDGMGLYQVLATQYPQLLPRVIFLTGDTLHMATMQQLEQLGALRLHKPFTAAAVRQVIQQALQRRPASAQL